MNAISNAAPARREAVPLHGFRLLVETEPWLNSFTRNLADCFRADPPGLRLSSHPGKYWADALVSRPVAWKQMGQSLLAHIVGVAAVVSASWLGLNQPRVILDEPQKTTAIPQYRLSEDLPEVRPRE